MLESICNSAATVYLLWTQWSEKRNKMISSAVYMQIMRPESQNVVLGTNLGVTINTTVK